MVQGSSHARLTMNHVAHCQWLHMGTVPTRVASTGTALRGGAAASWAFTGTTAASMRLTEIYPRRFYFILTSDF